VLSHVRIETLVSELDNEVPREGAFARLVQYGGGPDESYLVANERGFLRLGIEFLRASVAPQRQRGRNGGQILDIELDYVLDPDAEIGIDNLERRDPFEPDAPVANPTTWPERVRVTLIVLAGLAAIAVWLVGLVTVARWIG
jgi:hypothetical protein